MNNTEFWSLIEKSKSFEEERVQWLTEELSKRSISEIVDFEFVFQSYMNESYQSHLWGAAYLMMGGCSDDCFDYFRGWLISQGQEVYEKTLKNPEFLANYIDDENLGEEGVPQNEEFLNVGFDAYTLTKDGDPDEWDGDLYDELLDLLSQKGLESNNQIEFDWEDEDDLEGMFPALWDRFGENPLG